nr:ependymin-like [Paramormyrops kingsleyae]
MRALSLLAVCLGLAAVATEKPHPCILQGVSYEISYPNQTCKKAPLKTPFRPIEIPPDAKLLGKVVLGTNSDPSMGGVLVNSWAGAVPVLKAKYKLTFTEFGCLPISSQIHVENVGLIFTSFYDLAIWIEDPNEFIPPPSCDKAELQQTESEELKEFLRFII